MDMKTIYHNDGTVTYWSVYRQCWIRRTQIVPDRELAAMDTAEADRVIEHLSPTLLRNQTC